MLKTVMCPLCLKSSSVKLKKMIMGVVVTSDSKYSKSLNPYLARCDFCAYWFTHQESPLANYYIGEYSLLMQNFFTDQRLIVEGVYVDRAKYQASIVIEVAKVLGSKHILEVGAGKGLTAHHVLNNFPVDWIALHDPGALRYDNFWREYVNPISSHANLVELEDIAFDLGYTFFTLEHTETPFQDMKILAGMMRDQSVYLGAVPWLNGNPGDLLVGDHCSHFTVESLSKMFGRYKSDLGLQFKLLVNYPLRAIIYICSKSLDQLNKASEQLLNFGAGQHFINSNAIQENTDYELFSIAVRYWDVDVKVNGLKGETLWGAGFYSKLIMLRHHEREFNVCIDSNLALVGTEFSDPRGKNLIVMHSDDWLKNFSEKQRLWFGVSEAGKLAILKSNYDKLIKAGIEIAF